MMTTCSADEVSGREEQFRRLPEEARTGVPVSEPGQNEPRVHRVGSQETEPGDVSPDECHLLRTHCMGQ